MALTGIARIALVLLERAAELGLDRTGLLRSVGLDEAELREPDKRVPAAKIEDLWRAVVKLVPQSDLGFQIGSSFTSTSDAMRLPDFGSVVVRTSRSPTAAKA